MTKLESKPNEWRRVLKTMNCIEFVIKNGSPHFVIEVRRECHKMSSLSNFYYMESGKDQGGFIREKVMLVVDILKNEAQLHQERT